MENNYLFYNFIITFYLSLYMEPINSNQTDGKVTASYNTYICNPYLSFDAHKIIKMLYHKIKKLSGYKIFKHSCIFIFFLNYPNVIKFLYVKRKKTLLQDSVLPTNLPRISNWLYQPFCN